MQDIQRRYKSAIQLNNDLKKVLQKNAIEIKRLRQLVRVQYLNDNIDKVDLIHNIKNYLEAELVIDLSAKTRLQPYVKGRCMFYWFAKRYTDLTLKQMGEMMGSFDHSTVIHSLTIVDEYIQQNKTFSRDLKRYDEYIMKHFVNGELIENKDAEIAMLKSKVEYLENKFVNAN
jgi:chromosomal replication initiation ATPase DnaA